MTSPAEQDTANPDAEAADVESASVPAEAAHRPREIGGPAGPEPTRFGDWERGGRCVDF